MTKRVKLNEGRRQLAADPAVLLARQKVADATAELAEAEEAAGGEEEEDNSVHVHIHQGGEPGEHATTADQRLDAIEGTVTKLATTVETLVAKLTPTADQAAAAAAAVTAAEALAKAKTGDAVDGEGDSKALADSYTKVLAQAEVLVPGFRVPTFDAAAKRKVTIDQMCQARRKCLELAHVTKDGQALIDGVAGMPLDLEKMDCAAVAVVFNAAATLKAATNNRSATGDSSGLPANKQPEAKPAMTFTDINKAAADFWAAQERANQSTPA